MADLPLAVLLVALGTALCLHHGRVGFMPLDQSIVFDGAWRLLCGQKPFRDFVVPNGLTPMAMQAAFFKAFGVTWFAYCFHASVVNGLFCAAAFAIFRVLRAGRPFAFFYGLLSGVVFYPPFGVPFMDQHSFFFMLLAVLAARLSGLARGRWAQAAGFVLPVLLMLGFLSKQLPSVLIPFVAGVAFFVDRPRDARGVACGIVFGTLFCAALLATAFRLVAADLTLLKTYAFELPSGVGRARVAQLMAPSEYVATMAEVRRAWGMISADIIPGAFGVSLVLVGRTLESRSAWSRAGMFAVGPLLFLSLCPSLPRGLAALAMLGAGVVPWPPLDACGRALRRGLGPLLLAQSLLLVCVIHAALTYNQPHNAIPYIFVAFGLLHIALFRSLPTDGGRALKVALTVVMLAAAARDALSFEARVNVTRRVHKLDRLSLPLVGAAGLPPAMSFLWWQTPTESSLQPPDLGDVLHFLERRRPFFLLGDSSILYALAGQPSVGPSVWFHPGLTYPLPATRGFSLYEKALLDSIKRHRVGYLVIENERTFMRTQLADFPALEDLRRRTECERRRLGAFTIVTLCD